VPRSLERERIVAEHARVLLDVGERGARRFAVALDRSAFPEPGDAVVADLNLGDLCDVGALARDDEGLGELEARAPGVDLHRG